MSKLFNIRPRWRNLLLARILLFAISIVLSSNGEDIGPNDTIEQLQSGGMYINVRGLQSSKSAKSKLNKSSKSKGSKSKSSKISGSKSKSAKAASKMGKSSDKNKLSKSKAAKSTTESKSKAGKSKSKASKSKSKIGKGSLDSGDDTESRDGNSSSDSVESDTQPVEDDNEKSDSVETSSLNRYDIDYVEEDKSLDSSRYSSSMDVEDAVENVDIISTEEEIVSTKDGKTYNAIQLPVSSEDEINIDTTHLDGDFMKERIDESEDTEVDIDEIMTEITEENKAFENMFDESDTELDVSRESVE